MESMECPICFELPTPPIYQCCNGHIVCSECLKKINTCAICREQLPTKPIRCLMAEQMAELQISNPGERKLKPIEFCNLLGLKDAFDCEESISKDNIVAHMKRHGLNGVNSSKADIFQEFEDFANPQIWLPIYFEAHGEIFFLLSSMKKDLSSSPLISWTCVMAENALAAEQFCLQLCLTNSDKVFNCL